MRPRNALTADEVKNFKTLAELLGRPISFYPRTVTYIRRLLTIAAGEIVLMPVLTWLQRDMPVHEPVQISTGNQEFEHLPQTSWRLTVKHRW